MGDKLFLRATQSKGIGFSLRPPRFTQYRYMDYEIRRWSVTPTNSTKVISNTLWRVAWSMFGLSFVRRLVPVGWFIYSGPPFCFEIWFASVLGFGLFRWCCSFCQPSTLISLWWQVPYVSGVKLEWCPGRFLENALTTHSAYNPENYLIRDWNRHSPRYGKLPNLLGETVVWTQGRRSFGRIGRFMFQ